MENKKNIIEKFLSQLIGLEFTRTTRAANMECLKFGHLLSTLKNGKEVNIGEFGLHIQCAWRITNETEIIVGSLDCYEQIDEFAEYNENFNWDTVGGNLRDVRLDKILSENKLIVKSIEVDSFGGFNMAFENGMNLTVFTNSSLKNQYNELWRLMNNTDKSKNHFVVNVTGIEVI